MRMIFGVKNVKFFLQKSLQVIGIRILANAIIFYFNNIYELIIYKYYMSTYLINLVKLIDKLKCHKEISNTISLTL